MPAKTAAEESAAIPPVTVEPEVPLALIAPLVAPAAPVEPVTESAKTHGVYATEYFKRNKIPYCAECGAQYQHNEYGQPVCAEGLTTGCPRIK